MKCKTCGNELIPGTAFCGKCGSPVEITREEYGSLSMGITLGSDEKIVKRYKIGKYTLGQGTTEVIISNKRVIRYEDSKWLGFQTNQMDEINIDAVHGVATHIQRSISIPGIIIALLLLLIGMSGGYRMFLSGSILNNIALVAAALVGWISIRPTMSFYLYGSVGAPALMTSINSRGKLFGRNDTSAVFQFKPTEETIKMMKEIGACIFDLKTMGDEAISKWSDVSNSVENY